MRQTAFVCPCLLNFLCCAWMMPLFKWWRSLHHLSERSFIPCAQEVFSNLSLRVKFVCWIAKSHSTSIPLVRPVVLLQAQLSCPCNFLMLSPAVWHAKWKRTLCIHQSPTASDRGYSATEARYAKFLQNEFQSVWAIMVCNHNGSDQHGVIQSEVGTHWIQNTYLVLHREWNIHTVYQCCSGTSKVM